MSLLLLLKAAAATYLSEVLSDSPVGYWRLGEPSGATAEDSSGNNLDGTYTNSPTLAQAGALVGDADTAVSFDGTDDYVALSNPVALRLTSAWTLEAWCFVPTGETQEAALIAQEFNTGNVQYMLGFFDGSFQTLAPSVGFYNGGWNIANSASQISTNAWHHIAGTWDGTILRIYVDGTEMDTTTPGGSPTSTSDPFRIGSRWDASGSHKYKGRIDEIAIYGTALSAPRILAHYLAGSTTPTGLPAAVAGVGAVPSAVASGAGIAIPAAVAGVGAIPAPTASGGNAATPAAVVGIGAVPTATGLGASTALPSAVAGVGAVPASTASGAAGATATPGVVAGIGLVPASTARGTSFAIPARVIGIGAVPAPLIIIAPFVTPATVAGIGRVPHPTSEGEGTGGGGGTSNGATDFWSIVIARGVTAYEPVVLPQLESWVGSFATAINDSGVIVGVALDAGSPFIYRAVRWTTLLSIPEVLALPGDAEDGSFFSSYPYDVNADGVVCGSYTRPVGIGSGNRAVRWSAGGTPTALGFFESVPGEEISDAFGINDDGIVVGAIDQDPAAEGSTPQPCYWIGTIPTVLALPADIEDYDYVQGRASAINNNGVIVGGVSTFPSTRNPVVRWDAGVPSLLESLGVDGDDDNDAVAINNLDQMGGYSYEDSDGLGHAVVWEGTAITRNLGSVGDADVLGINDAGLVVGEADFSGIYSAVVWNGLVITQLSNPDGYDQGASANNINSDGVIVGSAYSLDATVAVIWSPS